MSADRYLIDTTIWVRYFGGEASVEDRVRSLILQDKVLTTGIIILETLRGARTASEYSQLYRDFKALTLLSLDASVWEESYKLGFKLRKSGVVVPLPDILISALAIRYECPLMHRDKHFSLIAQHSKLKEYQV
jgi:predicted nucleic acid-binding protein